MRRVVIESFARFLAFLCLILGMTLVFQVTAQASIYDLVILNGRVMDPETGFDGVRNVGITDGKIITITEKNISGSETIDAAGLVVGPGFIDIHFHSLTPMGIKMGLRDGVTTGMDLELGALEIDAWYTEKKGQWQINYGTTIGQEFVRRKLFDGISG
jgi:N-acyl-D-amino-acid deacylase